jgi:hypothetical protein
MSITYNPSFSQPATEIVDNGTVGPAPLVVGWSGLQINESSRAGSSNPPSAAFPGEQASDMEVNLQIMKGRGQNGFRMDFQDPVLGTVFNLTDYTRAIQLAAFYNMWMVPNSTLGDGFNPSDEANWLNFWFTQAFPPPINYPKIVWSPFSEPAFTDAQLRQYYQDWITMARNAGDTHWIVISTNYSNYGFFPSLNDPLRQLFYSLHPYFFYADNSQNWTVSAAQASADSVTQDIINVQNSFGPVLLTEGGPDAKGPGGPSPPDLFADGSANYTPESLAFVQRLISNLDSMNPRVGYLIWPCGDWTGSSGAGVTGGLNIFGQLLSILPAA